MAYWTFYSKSRKEYYCEHGIGHGEHVHGCDGCCSDGLPVGLKDQLSQKDEFDPLPF